MVIIIVLIVLGIILIAMMAIARMVHHHELSLGVQHIAQILLPVIIGFVNSQSNRKNN